MNALAFLFRRPVMRGHRDTGMVLLLSVLVPAVVSAQLVTGRFSTSAYTWEKFDTVGSSTTYLRGFQTVQLGIAEGDVSLHTYMTGAISTPEEAALIRLYNLYLRWAKIGGVADLSLGRQAVYAGVGTGTIDGLSARFRLLQNKVTLVGFGGAAPKPGYRGVRDDVHANLAFGGQILTTAIPGARIGLSYLNRKEARDPYWALRARDTAYTPVPYLITFEPDAEELLGGDAYYAYGSLFSVYGRYDHDLKTARTMRVQGNLRVHVTPRLALTADYMHRLPRVSFNSIFSAFVQNAVDEVEGGAEYEVLPLMRVFARVGSVSYSDDESSARWTLGLNTGYGTLSYSGSNGYAGELQSFTVQGGYPLAEGLIVPGAGVSIASYKISDVEARSTAVSLLLGATVRPSSSLSFDVQGQYMTNKVYQRDLRGLLKINYWFKERLSLFGREAL